MPVSHSEYCDPVRLEPGSVHPVTVTVSSHVHQSRRYLEDPISLESSATTGSHNLFPSFSTQVPEL